MAWSRVKWSEAHQVLDLMKTAPEARDAAASGPPADYFALLRREGRRREAADFLGQALPRLEVIAWAARAVRDAAGAQDGGKPSARALRSALLWVQDPTDNRRRAAYEAAQACGLEGAEALAALAVFFSGGSIAPADCPAVQPPRGIAGGFAAVAVKIAAGRSANANAALDRALDAGAAMAEQGIAAGA